MGRACGMYVEKNAEKLSVRKPEGKRQLGRLVQGEKLDNKKTNLVETGFGIVNWVYILHDRDRGELF
jgi:hypothetical protein